ncbi:zinc finger protein [Scheffersomyces xylosifermentans]|uniref:zinc finger protein n=1 Tax=Scheffersomyces xylosifermentans TaxID=1304137 RepID=UPI00315DCD8E
MLFFSLGLIHDNTNKSVSATGGNARLSSGNSSSTTVSTKFGALATKNLLGLKINVFKFLNDLIYKSSKISSNELFPPLLKSAVINLSNNKNQSKLPVNCAADDLDLSLGGANDQIEFFNNFVVSNNAGGMVDFHNSSGGVSATSSFSNNGVYSAGSVGLHGPSGPDCSGVNYHNHLNNDLPEFDDFYEAHSHHHHASHNSSKQVRIPQHSFEDDDDLFSNADFDGKHSSHSMPVPQSFHHHQIVNKNQDFIDVNKANLTLIPVPSLSLSKRLQKNLPPQHKDDFNDFNMNVFGLNNDSPYFNDFMHNDNNAQLQDDYFSSSVSSSESFISPLDDELFKKFNSNENEDQRMSSTSSSFSNVGGLFDDDEIFGIQTDENMSKKRKFDSISSNSTNASVVTSFEIEQEKILNEVPSSLPSLPPQSKQVPKSPNMKKYKKTAKKEKSMPKAPKKSKLTATLAAMSRASEELSNAALMSRNTSVASLTSTIGERKKSIRPRGDSEGGLPHECPHCDAAFKVKGYLTRHLKKHNSAKAFMCPFFQEPADGNSGTKCHPTGGFSRRDTYKTHLKALHFIYPPGTKSNERNSISGRCAGCFQYFENNFVWLAEHIESGDCKGTVKHKAELERGQQEKVVEEEQEIKVKTEFVEADLLKQEFEQHATHYIKQEILD